WSRVTVMNIKIEVREQPEVFYVQVGGELDIYTAPELKKVLSRIVSEGTHNLHVDLTNLTCMTSTGLCLFVGTLKDLNKYNKELSTAGANERSIKPFEIIGLYNLYHITKSVV